MQTAEQAGQVEAARRYHARLLEIAAAAGTPRPELAMARRYFGQAVGNLRT